MTDNNTPVSISDATLYALQQGGKDLLKNPQRLLSYLIDMASECPALTVLERNCDQELLEPLVQVVCDQPPTMQGIRFAASRIEDLLVNSRAVAPQAAHQAVEELCRGVIRYLAERSGAKPAAPTPDSTGAAPVQPQPQPAHPYTVMVTPHESEEPEPFQSQPVVLPAISSAPEPGDSTGNFRNPSPLTGTMPVESFPLTPAEPSPQPDTTGATPQQPEVITPPVQPTKPKPNKKLIIAAAIAAAVAIVAWLGVSMNRVTVSFDGGGATGSTSSVKTWRNTEVTLPSNSFTRSGYSFVGWDLDGKTYQPGDTLTPDNSTTLSAIWAAEVTFDDNGADKGSVDDMLALPGETITLPELDFERDGYRANGWEAYGEIYAAGDEVKVTGPVTYSIDWGARISFDGNGATSGKTSNVYADSNGKATAPECGFKYSDHVFKGWATSKTGSASYSPGDSLSSDSPETLYAVWQLDPNITDKLDISPMGINWDDGSHTTMLYVTNNSNTPLRLTAEFSFKNSSGDEIENKRDVKLSVAPGERTSLDQLCEESGFDSCDYTVSASEIEDGSAPLYGNVTVEENTVEAGKVVLRITNNSDKSAFVKSVSFYGKGYNGGEALYYKPVLSTIKPGEYLDVTFEASISADRARWNEYHTREFFLDGYIE